MKRRKFTKNDDVDDDDEEGGGVPDGTPCTIIKIGYCFSTLLIRHD
jgi:hypothetical protein